MPVHFIINSVWDTNSPEQFQVIRDSIVDIHQKRKSITQVIIRNWKIVENLAGLKEWLGYVHRVGLKSMLNILVRLQNFEN